MLLSTGFHLNGQTLGVHPDSKVRGNLYRIFNDITKADLDGTTFAYNYRMQPAHAIHTT